ncbi:Nuclease-related domain-containing protein [Halobacillus dabanensis]|uniref:Nuclease-related domain-containing protein n=1 Tax=Halobacillus dabanensis TaxID=240302 RepID=A0A1I3RNG2_HALDA|nr:nuclease-related domain-containing protein [Halobacillus dabanensis]SFJ47855.1 Nuclease-related domain-containing protein [Halobacillus dabanensis]
MLSKLFRKKKKEPQEKKPLQKKPNERGKAHISKRKGEIGEYKIDIQLDQMPKEYKHMSDLLIENPKSKSGYSQVDHVLITSYGIFVIETKNYQGTVYGGKDRKTWSVNGKFKMMNPFFQNYGHIQALKKIIGEKYEGSMVSIVSFTKRCTFKIDTNLRDIKENQLIVYDMELSEFINRKIHVQKLIHKQPLITAEEVQHIYGEIKKQHISNPDVLKRHVEALNDTSETTRSTCVVCEKEVSNKVKSFCLNNKKFEGKIYCYDHQK